MARAPTTFDDDDDFNDDDSRQEGANVCYPYLSCIREAHEFE
jgi:hypothetical protein